MESLKKYSVNEKEKKKEGNKTQEKQKTNAKTMDLNQLLIITLSVNGLSITKKKDRDYQIWGDRQHPNISCLQRTHIKYKDTNK